MRRLGGGVVACALLLAACNGAGGGNEARIALPLTAPVDAKGEIKDFIEVCSQALVDPTKALGSAATRGWKASGADMAVMALAGSYALERADNRSQLLINDIDYPHQHTRSCQVIMLDGDTAPDLAAIGNVAGIKGDVLELPMLGQKGSRGLWSFIGPDGDVVAVNSIYSPPRIVQLSMASSHRQKPKSP